MEALALSAAFLTSLVLGRIAITLGPRFGMVDLPDDEGLKPHQGALVPLGGAGVLAGVMAGLGALGVLNSGLLAAAGMMWVVGLADDRIGLDPKIRLTAAAGAGVLLGVLGDARTSWPLVLVAVVLVVVTANAVNLLDGLDGLAGSVTAVAAVGLTMLGLLRDTGTPLAGAVMVAALIGFLVWNYPPARLILGDNGAYVIGVVLAWTVLAESPDWSAGLVSLAVIGVPFLDLGVTVVRRARSHAPLFRGDRDHLYDRLHQAGVGVETVAAIFATAEALWCAMVITVAYLLGDLPAIATAVVLGAVIVAWGGLGGPLRHRGDAPPSS